MLSLVHRLIGIVTAPFVLLLIVSSGLLVNLLQFLVCSLLFLSPTVRLSLNQRLANAWWPLWLFFVEPWGKVSYLFTGDVNAMPKASNVLLFGNHLPGIDFVNGVSIASIFNTWGCGRMMTIIKDSLKYIPALGIVLYMQGSLFLKRNWDADQKRMTMKLQEIKDQVFPNPFWLGIYPEGTRATKKKLEQSQQFARERGGGLPILENVLLPRTKGFTFITDRLKGLFHYAIDGTNAYSGAPLIVAHPFIYGRFLTKRINIHINVMDLQTNTSQKALFQEGNEQSQSDFLMNLFQQKDTLLNYFKRFQHFPVPGAGAGPAAGSKSVASSNDDLKSYLSSLPPLTGENRPKSDSHLPTESKQAILRARELFIVNSNKRSGKFSMFHLIPQPGMSRGDRIDTLRRLFIVWVFIIAACLHFSCSCALPSWLSWFPIATNSWAAMTLIFGLLSLVHTLFPTSDL